MRLPAARHICTLFIIAALAGVISGCAREVPLTETVRFTVFGNTSPVSPFSGFTKSLGGLIAGIESEKTAIVIHTGDAIYGGSESDGITERDAKRQYGIFFARLKNFHSVYYTIPGERDLFNGETSLYSEFSGRKPYYSFNYGSIHFVTLDTTAPGESFIDGKQMKWLADDLEYFSTSNAIFILFHRPFITSKKRGDALPVPEELHALFMKHKVTAVISGGEKSYSNRKFDSVQYISAGCAGYNDEKENRRTNQYYIFSYRNSGLAVDPVHFDIQKNN